MTEQELNTWQNQEKINQLNRFQAIEKNVDLLKNEMIDFLKEQIEFREEQGKLMDDVIKRITTIIGAVSDSSSNNS